MDTTMHSVILLATTLTLFFHEKALCLDVRLAGGKNAYEGRVEVFHENKWGSVCDDRWQNHINCMIVCSQLSFSGGTMLPDSSAFGTSTGPIMLDDVQCSGDERRLGECAMSNFYQNDCSHKEDVACRCHPLPITGKCHTTSHRITPIDHATPWVGRAEVLVGGSWKAICDDHWDDLDAAVFCNCNSPYNQTAQYRAFWSKALSQLAALPLAFDSVDCTEVDKSAKKNLWDCETTPATGTCSGVRQAAGVACGALPPSVIPEAPEVVLECTAGHLKACFTTDTYKLEKTYLSLNPACTQSTTHDIPSGICTNVDMEKCTVTRITVNHSEKRFCYDMTYSSDSATLLTDPVWTREVCCHQKKNGTAWSNGELVGATRGPGHQVIMPAPHQPKSVKSPIKYTLDCYLNSLFTGPKATRFAHGADVYCRLETDIWDDELDLVVHTCNFYGHPSGRPSFSFLKNKCPTTDVLGLHFYNFDKHSWGFMFQAPKFPSTDQLYIACDAYVCDPARDPKPYCDRSCSASRMRRDVNQMPHSEGHVIAGPFTITSSGSGQLLLGSTGSVLSDKSIAVPAVAQHQPDIQSNHINQIPKKSPVMVAGHQSTTPIPGATVNKLSAQHPTISFVDKKRQQATGKAQAKKALDDYHSMRETAKEKLKASRKAPVVSMQHTDTHSNDVNQIPKQSSTKVEVWYRNSGTAAPLGHVPLVTETDGGVTPHLTSCITFLLAIFILLVFFYFC